MDGGGWAELRRLQNRLDGIDDEPRAAKPSDLPPPDYHPCAPVNCGCPECRDARLGIDWTDL